MPEIKDKSIVLRNGKLIPFLGLGSWQSEAGEAEQAVEVALDNGYRHIDTAYNYLNEAEVGQGIQNWIKKDPENNKREDLFIVTKLPGIGMSPEGVRKFLSLSLKALKVSYIDLYLIHTPIGFKAGPHDKYDFPCLEDGQLNIDEGTDLIAIWKEMEKMVDAGKIKSIGVSNFSIKQLRKIEAISIIPCVANQIELNAEFQQREMAKFCNEKNIIITAYAPLGSPGRDVFKAVDLASKVCTLLNNPVVTLISENHQVTTAQVLIKFLVQQGIVAIPKSVTPHRIISNGDIFKFSLSNTEMDAMKTLDKEGGRTFQLHTFPGMSSHPECVM